MIKYFKAWINSNEMITFSQRSIKPGSCKRHWWNKGKKITSLFKRKNNKDKKYNILSFVFISIDCIKNE